MDQGTNLTNLDKDKIYYTLALSLIEGIGPVNAKSLISYCGSAELVFKTHKERLLKIPGIGETTALSIVSHNVFKRADEEMKFIEKKNISCFIYSDDAYPQRLRNCIDAPILLFFSGNTNLNQEKIISIVGTRNATEYGKSICEDLISGLQQFPFLMVSGLAYGIDIAAHKACVKRNIETVGVVAHGLDRIYPPAHKDIAKNMMKNGGIITEYLSNTKPERVNFPQRNRIVAGMVDALIVIETAQDGGAVITAALANTYNRDVFAFPGDIKNKYARGCHYLIKTNRAQLIEGADDVIECMNWISKEKKPKLQRELFIEFSPEERLIYDVLKVRKELAIDELSSLVPLTPSAIASNLLNLEFQNVIASLPGKRYKLH